MNPTPERTEKKDGGAQARPFPFPLTLVERERDGSCYFVSSPDGKLDARHKRLVVFEVGCATDHAKHIEICVNSHADLVAQNEALRGALEQIAAYDKHSSKHGEGICPYGCDCPHIAQQALAKLLTNPQKNEHEN